MKRISLLVMLFAFLVLTLGCATPFPLGQLYTGIKSPVAVGDGSVNYTKVGEASAKSYFGLIATGDSSIERAKANGGIKNIKFVDYKVENVLGIVGTYTTIVYGD